MRQPNIIIFTTDQQRFDTLGINGAEVSTPNIDKVASEGVNFTNAFIQNTVCVPNRACIQTGRYPHQHGVIYMEKVVDNTPGLPDHEKTFMEYLQEAGYYTGATGKIHMFPEKGFHWTNLTGGKGRRWAYIKDPELGEAPLGENYARWLESKRKGAYEELYEARRRQESFHKIGVMDIPLSDEEYVETWIAEQSIEFIKRHANSSKPFFLWCGFCGPHDPFDPPEPWKSMYDPKKMPLPREFKGWPSWRDKYDEDLMRKCVAYYRALVSCIDHHIGSIVNTLKELGIYENTLLVFVSDHGEMLGERGIIGKCVFYDSVLHVPMWIKPPKDFEYKRRNFDGLVETMSIAPTILEFAGIDIPKNMTAKSLVPILKGIEDKGEEMVFSEYVSNDKKEVNKCIRTKKYKYIRYFKSGKEELYDLEKDPYEEYNVAGSPEYREELLKLRDMMLTKLALTEWRYNL